MRYFTSMILTLILITGTTAQDLKTNIIGTDIGALAMGGIALEYKKLINDGKNEIGVGGGMFKMSDNATWNGGWAWYRIYKNGNGEGVFYAVGCGFGPVGKQPARESIIKKGILNGKAIWLQFKLQGHFKR